MPGFDTRSKMPFWDVGLAGVDITALFKKYISAISVKYKTNHPTTATITVTSPSYMEDLLIEPMPVNIWMGWGRGEKVLMFKGQISGRPDGQASDMIGYTVNCVDDVVNLAKNSKNRNDFPPLKAHIATVVIAEGGYIPRVTIADNNVIDMDKIPMQKNETNLEFLARCAEQWNCRWWINGETFYFVDAETAHSMGDVDRLYSYEDHLPQYSLNYRLGHGKNNISKISWKKYDAKGGIPGTPGVKGADEFGPVVSPGDYPPGVTTYGLGKFWKLKEGVKEEIANNFLLSSKYIASMGAAAVAEMEEKMKEYFVPVTHKSGGGTHVNKSHPPKDKEKGFKITAELNKGDPFLRPPRTAALSAGTVGHKTSDLPFFLFHEGKNGSRYNINEVETSLKSGMIQTKIVATA